MNWFYQKPLTLRSPRLLAATSVQVITRCSSHQVLWRPLPPFGAKPHCLRDMHIPCPLLPVLQILCTNFYTCCSKLIPVNVLTKLPKPRLQRVAYVFPLYKPCATEVWQFSGCFKTMLWLSSHINRCSRWKMQIKPHNLVISSSREEIFEKFQFHSQRVN